MELRRKREMNKEPQNKNSDSEKEILEEKANAAANAEGAEDTAETEKEEPAQQAENPELAEEPAEAGEPEESEEEPTTEKEVKLARKAELKKNRRERRKAFFGSSKFRHGGISTVFTIGFIAIMVLLNVLVGILANKYPSINLDFTNGSTNTLSTQAETVVDSVNIPVTVYICASEESTKSNSIMKGYSQVGTLAAKMAERNSNITVQYIDLDTNPTFKTNFSKETLTAGDVIVQSSKRYRHLTTSDLFDTEYNSSYTSSVSYSNVDSSLASSLNMVTSDTLPVVAIDTGHSEQLSTTAYETLLKNNSFETQSFNLLTDAIPDNTQLVILGDPTTDLTDDEITKLQNFLTGTTSAVDRSVMLTFSPNGITMPKLTTFMQEWGLSVDTSSMIEESDATKCVGYYPYVILPSIQTTLDLGGGTYTGYYVSYEAAPVDILFASKGDITTYSLIKSSDASYLADATGSAGSDATKQAYNVGALSQQAVTVNGKSCKANLIVLGDSISLDANTGIISSNTFINGTYAVDLARYSTGTSNSDLKVTTSNAKSLNATDITMNSLEATIYGLWIFTILIPLAIAIIGIVVHHKRRLL